jgi:hypothetical protein
MKADSILLTSNREMDPLVIKLINIEDSIINDCASIYSLNGIN